MAQLYFKFGSQIWECHHMLSGFLFFGIGNLFGDYTSKADNIVLDLIYLKI